MIRTFRCVAAALALAVTAGFTATSAQAAPGLASTDSTQSAESTDSESPREETLEEADAAPTDEASPPDESTSSKRLGSSVEAHASIVKNGYTIKGGILARYEIDGAKLGNPTANERCGLVDGGCWQPFQHGRIMWTSSTHGQSVFAGILRQYAVKGYEKGMGYPTAGYTAQDGAVVQKFTKGTLTAISTSKPKCSGIQGVSGITASKVIEVKWNSGSSATAYLCRKDSMGTYYRIHGGYSAALGYNGMAAVGAKKEGDGKTPAGTYWMRNGFGTSSNPGLGRPWTKVTSVHVWNDVSTSANYNTMQTSGPGESLYQTGPYKYAQVIGYNEARTPYKGSAIFLHRRTGASTAGCVSLYESSLVTTMKWEGPSSVQIRIH